MGNSRIIRLIVLISFLSVFFHTSILLYAQNRTENYKRDSEILFTKNYPPIIPHFIGLDFHQTKKDSNDTYNQKKIYLTLRMGLGSSAHLGESNQIAIDVKANKIPLALSFVSESYRKPPLKKEYSKPYDTFFYAINMLFMPYQPMEKRVNFFMGGGFGRVEVEKYERSDDHDWRQKPFDIENGLISNLKLGLHLRLFWKLGFYAEGAYIYAKKEKNGEHLIDLNSSAWMAGLTLNFGFFDKLD